MRDTEEMEAEVEFDEGEEPSFSDPEDFVDDISDEGRSILPQAPPPRASRLSGPKTSRYLFTYVFVFVYFLNRLFIYAVHLAQLP